MRRFLLPLLVVLAPLPIYLMRTDHTVGMMADDAWYVLLGRALAEGKGYWLVNAPVDGILPGYPPGFPALLALVFMIDGRFPENLWLLKGVSIAAMLGAALLTFVYLHRHRQVPREIAALAGGAVGMTPALVFLATSTVMSECVFLLAQLAAVVAAHRALDVPRRERRLVAGAAVLSAAAMMVRSAGVAVVAAVFLSLLKERRWTSAALFCAVVGALAGPWLIHARMHAPTAEQQAAHRGSIVYSYGDQFWMRRAGSALTGTIAPGELPARIATNAFDIVGRGAGGLALPALLRGADESGEEVLSLGGNFGWTFVGLGGAPINIALSLALAGIAAAGYVRTIRQRVTAAELLVPISLAITILWPWWTFRFVLPLAPFLALYFVQGLQLAGARATRIALLTMIGLHLADHGGYIVQARRDPARVDWLARFDEVDRTLTWMAAHVDAGAIVATTNPALVHLRTGRKTITLDTLTEPWAVWRQRGASVVACLVPHALPSRSRGPYAPAFESSDDLARRVWVIGIK